jgi:hypothetical protein
VFAEIGPRGTATLTNQQHHPTIDDPPLASRPRRAVNGRPGRSFPAWAAAAAAVLMVGLAVPPTTATAAQVPVMGADTARKLSGPPSGYTLPADGRLRGDGFTATITGVATSPGAATLRARPGQRLWVWGVTVTRGTPATGGAPVTVSMTLTAGSVNIPVPLPTPASTAASAGVSWFLASLPAAEDVTVTLSAKNSSAVFSLSKMSREDPQPAASYRDPGSWETTVSDPQTVTLPASFVDTQGFAYPVDPEPVMFTSATLAYWAPDQPGHTAATTDQAWLVVHLTSGGNDPNVAFADHTTLPGTDLTLTVPGMAPVAATDFPGPTVPADSSQAINPDIFGADTYAFQVPATVTTAALSVTPGSYPADGQGLGTATITGTATFTIALPTPVTPTPPAGASTRPGRLTALPATNTTGRSRANGAGTTKTAAPALDRSSGSSPTGLIATLIATLIAILAILGAGSVVVTRRRRTPAAAPADAPPGATAFRTHTPPPVSDGPGSPPVRAEGTDRSSPTGRPPAPATVYGHDRGADDHGAGGQGAGDSPGDRPSVEISAGRPPVLPDLVTPPVPVPSVRVLGRVRVDGFVDLPGQGPLVDLLIFLALHPDRAFLTDTLRGRLATGDDTEVAEGTMHSYVSRLRRHLPAGVEVVSSRTGYRLVGVTTDLAIFDDLADTTTTVVTTARAMVPAGETDLGAIASVSAALALVDGVPFDTEQTPRWITDETFRSGTQKKTAAAARRLDALTGPPGACDRALWGYHQALRADPADQALTADALVVAARHPRPGTLVHEWDQTVARLAGEGQEPSADLVAHYHRLRQQPHP